MIYQGQLAMTLGSRGQVHVYIRTYMCLYNYHQVILHNIDASRAYTLRAKYDRDIQSSWKYFPYTSTLNT